MVDKMNPKHDAVLSKAAAVIRARGHEGDARLSDSVLGLLASLRQQANRRAAPADVGEDGRDAQLAADAERYNKMLREDYSVARDHAPAKSVATFEAYRKKRNDYYDQQENP